MGACAPRGRENSPGERSLFLAPAGATGRVSASPPTAPRFPAAAQAHGIDDVRNFTGVPVLAGIPHITTHADLRARAVQAALSAGAVAMTLLLIFTIFALLASDNYTLVRMLSR